VDLGGLLQVYMLYSLYLSIFSLVHKMFRCIMEFRFILLDCLVPMKFKLSLDILLFKMGILLVAMLLMMYRRRVPVKVPDWCWCPPRALTSSTSCRRHSELPRVCGGDALTQSNVTTRLEYLAPQTTLRLSSCCISLMVLCNWVIGVKDPLVKQCQ